MLITAWVRAEAGVTAVTRADGLRIAQSAGRFHDIIGLNYNAMHGCILGSDPLQREAEFQPLLW